MAGYVLSRERCNRHRTYHILGQQTAGLADCFGCHCPVSDNLRQLHGHCPDDDLVAQGLDRAGRWTFGHAGPCFLFPCDCDAVDHPGRSCHRHQSPAGLTSSAIGPGGCGHTCDRALSHVATGASARLRRPQYCRNRPDADGHTVVSAVQCHCRRRRHSTGSSIYNRSVGAVCAGPLANFDYSGYFSLYHYWIDYSQRRRMECQYRCGVC